MEKINIPPSSVLTGHGHLQQADAERHGKYCLLRHMFLVLEELKMEEATPSGYGNSLSIDEKDDEKVGGKESAEFVKR